MGEPIRPRSGNVKNCRSFPTFTNSAEELCTLVFFRAQHDTSSYLSRVSAIARSAAPDGSLRLARGVPCWGLSFAVQLPRDGIISCNRAPPSRP